MKKIASILLLALLVFNWCGYRWVINWLQQSADVTLENKLDNNDYDESQLIEIRVPLNMPYQSNWSGFQRYDGEIEVKGVHYKYVKRKVEDGLLVLKCIPNAIKQRLQTARDDFFRLVNDLQQDQTAKKSTNSHSTTAKNMLGDYFFQQQPSLLAFSTILQYDYNLCPPAHINSCFHSTPEQPPEA